MELRQISSRSCTPVVPVPSRSSLLLPRLPTGRGTGSGVLAGLDESGLVGHGDQLRPVACCELAEDAADMGLDVLEQESGDAQPDRLQQDSSSSNVVSITTCTPARVGSTTKTAACWASSSCCLPGKHPRRRTGTMASPR